MTNLVLTALLSLVLLGCQGDFVDNSVHLADEPTIQELPDYDATLSPDVTLYVMSTAHSGAHVYTLPHIERLDEIEFTKIVDYCDKNNAIHFATSTGEVIAEITHEGSTYNCRGWATFATIGDSFEWHMTRFGGDVNW